MEHLALEVENLSGGGWQFAVLPENTTITIQDTSEIFASGDVWSHTFTLNIFSNAHIFGTAADIHGSRIHELINKRRARLWVDGLLLYTGYLKLEGEVEIDAKGDVDVSFESGRKTFDDMIDGIKAREVSVGDDVVIGVALNRKRVVNVGHGHSPMIKFTLDGLAPYAAKDSRLEGVERCVFEDELPRWEWENGQVVANAAASPFFQRWPKIVKSHGKVYRESGQSVVEEDIDYTNVQTPYDASHPFCNINICYQLKVNKQGEELTGRGYTMRLAHGKPTTHGGDNQTRYNNAPNFYLLYFIDRLFKDMKIHIEENQCLDVEDLRRVFLLNYGCHYEEIEDDREYYVSKEHTTPEDRSDKPFKSRYGQYYMPIIDNGGEQYLIKAWGFACDNNRGLGATDIPTGKILMREVKVSTPQSEPLLEVGSIEGTVVRQFDRMGDWDVPSLYLLMLSNWETDNNAYSSYLAYATNDNYPNVDINDIINAMKTMFGVRLLFNNDFTSVRIVLLRNVFQSNEVQDIDCDIVDKDEKIENGRRGFRMTYGKGKEDTSFFYKGFDDLFVREATTWKDSSDMHDYSQWDLSAVYDTLKQYISAFNKVCYVTPENGNAYIVKVDEDEDTLFPALFEAAGFMDAEDGDCTQLSEEEDTVEEVQCGASPVIMNDVNKTYASLFSGDMKAPSPDDWQYAEKILTYGKVLRFSTPYDDMGEAAGVSSFRVSGKLDVYLSEGFKIRLEDNYAVGNSGTPFDDADPGLCFGIMRSSGDDAFVRYAYDADDKEGNETWDITPGSGAISHPDTCDDYGNLFDYGGQILVTGSNQAITILNRLFPNRNAAFYYPDKGRLFSVAVVNVMVGDDNKEHSVMFAWKYASNTAVSKWEDVDFTEYLKCIQGKMWSEIMAIDAEGRYDIRNIIIAKDGSREMAKTCVSLCDMAYGGRTEPFFIDGGVASSYGRFSLKLRAEKPNPFFHKELPEVVTTRQEAEDAITELYTTSSSNLLTRHRVTFAALRAAGYDCPGDGYTATFGIRQSITCVDYSTYPILWTPIRANGTIMTYSQLMNYIGTFENLRFDEITAFDTEHMVLDIDTTNDRARTLEGLQAIYYAQAGEEPAPVDITSVNSKYLSIDNPDLRGRGLIDQFYKEYSYWTTHARIIKRTARMTLAQLLSIDKTKRVRIGSITGFIRKMEYPVSNNKGLGNVIMEIMYI